MKKIIKKYSSIFVLILLAAVVMKMGSLFLGVGKVRAESYPRHYIWQERDGQTCSYPHDCLDADNKIFYKFQLQQGSGGTCIIPKKGTRSETKEVRAKSLSIWLKLNNYTIKHITNFNESCEFETELSYQRLLFEPKTFPSPRDNHYLNIVVYDYTSTLPIYSFNTPIAVKTIETCREESPYCSGTLLSIKQVVWEVCNQLIGHPDQYKECAKCVEKEGVWTAIGCVPSHIEGILQTLVKVGLLIGGGIALLIILAGAFLLSISQGDPQKTSEAKEMITAALTGLIFIIFSVSILQFIGVQILQIPEFAEKATEYSDSMPTN